MSTNVKIKDTLICLQQRNKIFWYENLTSIVLKKSNLTASQTLSPGKIINLRLLLCITLNTYWSLHIQENGN